MGERGGKREGVGEGEIEREKERTFVPRAHFSHLEIATLRHFR